MAHLSFLGLQMAAWTTAVAPAPALRKHSTKCFLTLNTTSWCTVIQRAINWHLHRQIKSFSKSYSNFANMLLDLNFTTVAPGMPSCPTHTGLCGSATQCLRSRWKLKNLDHAGFFSGHTWESLQEACGCSRFSLGPTWSPFTVKLAPFYNILECGLKHQWYMDMNSKGSHICNLHKFGPGWNPNRQGHIPCLLSF